MDRLLDVSHWRAEARIGIDAHDLGDIVKEVVERLSEQAANAQQQLRLMSGSGINARLDRFRLEEAMGNVISNAIKYGAGHPVDHRAESAGRQSDPDRAGPRHRHSRRRIYREFRRFERTSISHNYSGLGLGLYIAGQIVEQHEDRSELKIELTVELES